MIAKRELLPLSELATKSDAELLDLLNEYLGWTVRGLVGAAEVVTLLDGRGVDLSGINKTILGYLRKIASGQLHPQLLVGWRELPVYNHARTLPMLNQQEVVDNKPIRVVTMKEGGGADAWLCEPRSMTGATAKQVFARDHIRDEGEQIAWLRGQVKPETKPDPLPYTIQGRAVVFNRACRLTLKDLKALVKAISES